MGIRTAGLRVEGKMKVGPMVEEKTAGWTAVWITL